MTLMGTTAASLLPLLQPFIPSLLGTSNKVGNNTGSMVAFFSQYWMYVSPRITLFGTGYLLLISFLSSHRWKVRKGLRPGDAYKSARNHFISRVYQTRAIRNKAYDLYLPSGCSIGSKVEQAMIFIPDTMVDCTAYSFVIGSISDGDRGDDNVNNEDSRNKKEKRNKIDCGVLIAVVNLEPLRMPSKHTGVSIASIREIQFEISTLLGIHVSTWSLGGHGQGGIIALSLLINQKQYLNNKKHEKSTNFSKAVIWECVSESAERVNFINSPNSSILVISTRRTSDANNTTEKSALVPKICSNNDKSKSSMTNSATHTNDDVIAYKYITGGNHSGYGHYDPSPPLFSVLDNSNTNVNSGSCRGQRSITLEKQQQLCANYTIEFLCRDRTQSSDQNYNTNNNNIHSSSSSSHVTAIHTANNNRSNKSINMKRYGAID